MRLQMRRIHDPNHRLDSGELSLLVYMGVLECRHPLMMPRELVDQRRTQYQLVRLSESNGQRRTLNICLSRCMAGVEHAPCCDAVQTSATQLDDYQGVSWIEMYSVGTQGIAKEGGGRAEGLTIV